MKEEAPKPTGTTFEDLGITPEELWPELFDAADRGDLVDEDDMPQSGKHQANEESK